MNFSAACVIIIYGEVIIRGKSEYDYIKNIIRRNYFMCGIVGYIGQRDCTDVLMQGLEKLEYRGYDSAGIAVFEKTGIKTVKTKGKLADMRHKLDIEGSPVGHCGIGHTRWATHGEPSDINSHPHTNGRVTIVHNGIIENYIELKEFLTEKGYTFTSQTDTEVVACLLDYYYSERNPLRAITETLKELKGSYALGIIFRDFPDRVYATRKESPLIVGIGENEYFIGSDIPAFLKYTKKYVLLDDNDIVCMNTEFPSRRRSALLSGTLSRLRSADTRISC